jgi:hypothetical protein
MGIRRCDHATWSGFDGKSDTAVTADEALPGLYKGQKLPISSSQATEVRSGLDKSNGLFGEGKSLASKTP